MTLICFGSEKNNPLINFVLIAQTYRLNAFDDRPEVSQNQCIIADQTQ